MPALGWLAASGGMDLVRIRCNPPAASPQDALSIAERIDM